MIDLILRAYSLEHDVRPTTLEHYRWVAHSFRQHLGHEPTSDDFSADVVNGYLRALKEREQPLSPWTVRQRRISLGTIWRAGHELGVIAAPPHKLRRCRCPDRVIETWSIPQVLQLIEHAQTLSGCFRDSLVKRSEFLTAWMRVGYDTGLRMSDMFLLETEHVLPRGRLVIVQRKTQFAVALQLRPETLQAVSRLTWRPSHGRYVFPSLWKENHFCRVFAKFVRSAGLRGTTTTLRQTSCTEVERLAPGMGWIHLGHKSPETTRQWYINRERAYQERPLPPLE